MKILIKSIKIILNILLTIIILFGLVFIGLFCFGIQPYVVESGSMEPAIQTGSICFINKKANYDDMKVGDVIAFELSTGAFATHRIVAITEEGFTTKGDVNSAVDSVITTQDNFIGENVYTIPRVGFIVKALQTARGRIILGTIILVLFVAGILIGEPSKKKVDN